MFIARFAATLAAIVLLTAIASLNSERSAPACHWSDTHQPNTLDLILSRDEQTSEQLVSKVAVQSAWFSDHHLLT